MLHGYTGVFCTSCQSKPHKHNIMTVEVRHSVCKITNTKCTKASQHDGNHCGKIMYSTNLMSSCMLLKHLAGHAAFINMYHRSEHFCYKSIFKAVTKMFAPQKRTTAAMVDNLDEKSTSVC